MARLFADENFPLPAVEALRRLGHDVLTAVEAGQAGQGIADDAVLALAHALGRAVLTHNRKQQALPKPASRRPRPQRPGPLHLEVRARPATAH